MTGERLRRRPDVLWRRSLQAVIVLPASARETHTLGGTGVALWELLAEWRTVDDLVGALAEAFGADPADVEHDVVPLLADLTVRGVVERAAFKAGAEAG